MTYCHTHMLYFNLQARKIEDFCVWRWTRKGIQAPTHRLLPSDGSTVAKFVVEPPVSTPSTAAAANSSK